MKRIALLALIPLGFTLSCSSMSWPVQQAATGSQDTILDLVRKFGPQGVERLLNTMDRNLTSEQATVLQEEARKQIALAEADKAKAQSSVAIESERQKTIRDRDLQQNETERTRFRAQIAQSEAERANAAANAAREEGLNIERRNQEAARQRAFQNQLQQQQAEENARHRGHAEQLQQSKIAEERRLETARVAENQRLERERVAAQRALEEERNRNLRDANREKTQEELQNQIKAAQATDRLTRKREEDRREAEKLAQAEAIARDAQAQAERLKREQDANAIKLKQEIEAAKAKAKADAEKEKEVKEHELRLWGQADKRDLLRDKASFEANLRKDETVAGINARIEAINKAFKEFTGDRQRMQSVGAFIVATVAGVLFFRHALPIVRQYVENRLFTPVLIEESSYSMLPDWAKGKKKEYQKSENLYFDGSMSDRVDEVRSTLINTKKHGGFYMNYLFYGPPGTGKTAVARALAYESGMDFAFMTGGSVLDLVKSGKAVQRFNEVFEWAQKSPKGLILFIDECDAFLGDPSKMSEELNSIFKNFLNKTGTESKNFCLILSTNHPDQLAKAIVSRVGYRQQLKFEAPSLNTRKKIITHFMEKYLHGSKLISEESTVISPKMISYIAEQTEGFSGRDISYLILGIEKAALSSEIPEINEKLITHIVGEAVEGFKQAQKFINHG